ncbi:hypothetical protein MTO96_008590 [Rhipicephalus appendiculatus]
MANQLFGLNAGVQLGPPNGPNEPLPPNQPVEPGFIGPIFDATSEHTKNWCLSKGDGQELRYYIGSMRSTSGIGNFQGLGPPNWRETQLQPLLKNFYREHFRVARRSLEQVEEYRKENSITIVKGGRRSKATAAPLRSQLPRVFSRGSRGKQLHLGSHTRPSTAVARRSQGQRPTCRSRNRS